jgi:hypothetical protein
MCERLRRRHPHNAKAKSAFGMHCVRFISPRKLRADLVSLVCPIQPSASDRIAQDVAVETFELRA